MRLILAAILFGLASPALAQSAIPTHDIIGGAIDGYIRPGFQHFAEESSSLELNVAALCATPSGDALATAQNQFRSTVIAFSRIEFIRIGPLGTGDRLERLLFWPDRKGIGRCGRCRRRSPTRIRPPQQRRRLRARVSPCRASSPSNICCSAPATTNSARPPAPIRCRYAACDPRGSSASSRRPSMPKWQDRAQMGHLRTAADHPQPAHDDYRTETEVLEKLAATLIHGTEAIRDQRIGPIISEATGSPKPRSALFWRSSMTVPSLAADFAGLHDFFLRPDIPRRLVPKTSGLPRAPVSSSRTPPGPPPRSPTRWNRRSLIRVSCRRSNIW